MNLGFLSNGDGQVVMEKKLLEDIQRLGLNTYEAKVYLALLERDSLSVGEVSKISQVPRARAYDILDSLAADGLAVLKPGRYKRYSAADPDSFHERLLSQNEKRYSEQKKIIERATLTLKRKFESGTNNRGLSFDPLEYVEIIKNPYQIHKRFMELVGEAAREILIFTKPPYSGPRERLEEQTEQQVELLRQGMSIRSIYEIPTDEKELEWWFRDIDAAAGHGEEARVIEELPMKMAIFDEKIVMIPLEDPISVATSFTAQIVAHRALARGLKILFETLWAQARDYHALEDYGEVLRSDKTRGKL